MHTEAFTQGSPYTEHLSHKALSTQTLLHRAAFTHRSLLHIKAFTRSSFIHAEASTRGSLLHTEAFTRRTAAASQHPHTLRRLCKCRACHGGAAMVSRVQRLCTETLQAARLPRGPCGAAASQRPETTEALTQSSGSRGVLASSCGVPVCKSARRLSKCPRLPSGAAAAPQHPAAASQRLETCAAPATHSSRIVYGDSPSPAPATRSRSVPASSRGIPASRDSTEISSSAAPAMRSSS